MRGGAAAGVAPRPARARRREFFLILVGEAKYCTQTAAASVGKRRCLLRPQVVAASAMADEAGATPSDEPPAAAKASVPPKVLRAHFEDRFDRVIEEALRNVEAETARRAREPTTSAIVPSG